MATDDTRSYAPEAIAGGLAVLPAANLAIRKKSKHRFDAPHIPMYDDVSMLDKHMQPGDVLVGGYRTGSPAVVDQYFSGNPMYHAEVVTETGARGPRAAYGGQSNYASPEEAYKSPGKVSVKDYEDAYILRPKVPLDVEKLRRSGAAQSVRKYDIGGAIAGSVADAFIPDNPLTGKIPDLNCEGGYCVGGSAAAVEDATGRRVSSSRPAWATNTGDLLRSDLFEPVASYSHPEGGFLRSNPTGELSRGKQYAARAALGTSIAAPAYALMNNPLAALGGAVAAPAALYAARKGARKFAPRAAEAIAERYDTAFNKYMPEKARDARNTLQMLNHEGANALLPAYLGGTAAGALAPQLQMDWPEKKASMDLNFHSQQEADAHRTTRNVAGIGGAALGAYAGGRLGARFGGMKGRLGVGLVGGLLGHAVGRVGADTAHDMPQRALHTMHSTTNTLDQAGGSGIRVASAQPSASEFAEFAQGESEGRGEVRQNNDEASLAKWLRPPQFGPSTALEGGEATTTTGAPMGLQGSGAV